MRNARSFRPSFLLSHTWLSKAAEKLATTLLPQPGKKPRVSAKRHPEHSCSTATLKPARFAFWEFLPQARSLFFLRAPTFELRHLLTCFSSMEQDFMEKPLYIWYDYFSCPQAGFGGWFPGPSFYGTNFRLVSSSLLFFWLASS